MTSPLFSQVFKNMENFTPYSALIGGVLIGSSAALLLVLNGRIAGISGITREILPPWNNAVTWRLCFLAGLIVAPLLYQLFGGYIVVQLNNPSLWLMAVSGLLVGYGTSLGSGCTSGHSVCGLARLSARSFAATLTFMFTAVLTVYIARHVIHLGV